jgi:hypothetical protein
MFGSRKNVWIGTEKCVEIQEGDPVAKDPIGSDPSFQSRAESKVGSKNVYHCRASRENL